MSFTGGIPPTAAEQARSFLVSHTVGDIRKSRECQKVVLIKDSATVEQALLELASHRILSAPVVSCPETEDPSKPTWPMDSPTDDTLGFIGRSYIGMSRT